MIFFSSVGSGVHRGGGGAGATPLPPIGHIVGGNHSVGGF